MIESWLIIYILWYYLCFLNVWFKREFFIKNKCIVDIDFVYVIGFIKIGRW